MTEDKLIFNKYDKDPTKLAKISHREKAFVDDTDTYSDEQNGDCVPYSVGFFLLRKTGLSAYNIKRYHLNEIESTPWN